MESASARSRGIIDATNELTKLRQKSSGIYTTLNALEKSKTTEGNSDGSYGRLIKRPLRYDEGSLREELTKTEGRILAIRIKYPFLFPSR